MNQLNVQLMIIVNFHQHVPFRSDAVAQGRKILSAVEECGMNRFNDPKVFDYGIIGKKYRLI